MRRKCPLPEVLQNRLTSARHRRAFIHYFQPEAGDRAMHRRHRGGFPSLNARPARTLEEWLEEITAALAAWDAAHPEQKRRPTRSI